MRSYLTKEQMEANLERQGRVSKMLDNKEFERFKFLAGELFATGHIHQHWIAELIALEVRATNEQKRKVYGNFA